MINEYLLEPMLGIFENCTIRWRLSSWCDIYGFHDDLEIATNTCKNKIATKW